MNRAQRRATMKRLRREYGKTRAEAEAIVAFWQFKDMNPEFENGQKVKLNYDKITSDADWAKMQDGYKKFVESHKDDVLTVCHDTIPERKDGYNCRVCFVEDDDKWAFWTGDLIAVKENG